jgi:hypothetical protein
MIARQFGGAAEVLSSRNGDRTMLLREFVHPLGRPFHEARCRLGRPSFDRGGRGEFDQSPLADRETLAGGLKPVDSGVAIRFANEQRNERARI